MSEPNKPAAKQKKVFDIHPEGQRIHPKKATGRFANLRIFVLLATQIFFYGVPWLMWNNRQAVWFDIGGRHFYLFDIVLVPSDLFY